MEENYSIYDMVENIVQVVFYTHFSFVDSKELKEDLMQVGFLKAYELLNNGNYDPTMALRNFLYTGIRNEMHNTLYHLGKIPTSSLDVLDKYNNVVGYNQVKDYEVDKDVIKNICNRYKKFGDYYPIVANYLSNLGILEEKTYKEPIVDEKLVESIITLTLWELYEMEVVNGW